MENKVASRIKSQSKPSNLLDAISRVGFYAGTGQFLPDSGDDDLDTQLKLQRLQTGDPDFQMKLAQTKADIAAQQSLAIEELKRQEAIKRATDAGYVSNGEPQESSPIPNPPASGATFGVPQPEPRIPSFTGQMLSMSQTKGPRFIQVPKTPATQKYDPTLGKMVNVPAEYGYDLDPAYKAEQEAQTNLAKKEGELQVKRKDFKNALDAFTAVGNQIPRKFGAERFEQGLNNIQSRFMQEQGDPLAAASSTYEGARKNLRVAVARLKDVGNLSETEQAAAGLLVPTDIDSPEVYQTKIAYLNALAGASSPDEIKRLIKSFSSGQPVPQKQASVGDDFSQMSDDELRAIAGIK